MARETSGSRTAVLAALVSNAAIAVAKLTAAAFTGSTAMLAEGAHSIADTGNEALLLLGAYLAGRGATERYALGRGAERYFWAFLVSVLLFGVGGGFGIYEGLHRLYQVETLAAPSGEASPWWNYGVLAFALVFESTSWFIAVRQLHRAKGAGESMIDAFLQTKDPNLAVVALEDSAALVGILLAATGVTLSWVTGWHGWDGIASLCIGVLLCVVAVVLAREIHGMLVGESAEPAERQRVRAVAEQVSGVLGVHQILTRHFGPHDVMVALKVQFATELSVAEIEAAIDELEARVRRELPKMRHIFVEPDSTHRDGRDVEIEG